MDILVRYATKDDIHDISDIYNQGIEDRVANLETSPKSYGEMLQWFNSHDIDHPVLAAESNKTIVGFASINVFDKT